VCVKEGLGNFKFDEEGRNKKNKCVCLMCSFFLVKLSACSGPARILRTTTKTPTIAIFLAPILNFETTLKKGTF
jgi:hypothetical protein